MGTVYRSLEEIESIPNKRVRELIRKQYLQMQAEELKKVIKKQNKEKVEHQGEKRQIALCLPYPLSVNEMYVTIADPSTPTGTRRVLSKKGMDYKRNVKGLTSGLPMLFGDIGYKGTLFRPTTRGDLSNRLKGMEDALEGILFENDGQISEINIKRKTDSSNPRFELIFYEV